MITMMMVMIMVMMMVMIMVMIMVMMMAMIMVMMMAMMDGAAALGQRGRLVRGFEIVLTVRPCRIGLVGNVDIRHGSLGDRLPAHSGGFGRKRACGIKLCSLARCCSSPAPHAERTP